MASSVEINLKLLTASFDKGMSNVNKQLKANNSALSSFTGNLAAIGFSKLISGATQAAGAILDFGQASIQAAVDAGETESKFVAVFSTITDSANNMAKELQKAYGLGVVESKTLLSATGDLLTGFGFAEEQALALSGEVQKLAVDLASFTNFSGGAAGASEALTKALLGERESIKALGISIQEKDVQEQVALNTAGGLTFATERQAKAQATLQLAIKQSQNAIGDYGKTSESAANQLKKYNTNIDNLSIAFGKGFVPAIQPAILEINQFLEAIDQDQVTAFVKDGILVLIEGLQAVVPWINPIVNGFRVMGEVFNIIQNGITSGMSAIVGVVALVAQRVIDNWRFVLEALPSSLVPDGWIEGLNSASMALDDTMKTMVESIEVDSQDMSNSLNNIVNPENMISEDKLDLLKEKLALVKDAVISADIETQIAQAELEKKKAALAKKKAAQDKALQDKKNKDSLKQSKFEEALFGKQVSWEKSGGEDRAKNLRSTLDTMSTLTSSNNKALFTIGKASAIATATIDGIAATQKALASAPPPFNFVLAGIVGTASALNVAKIASSKPPSAGNFADGGFIPGTSFSGDRLTANVNSGEAVLNSTQQREFMDLANGGSGNSEMAVAINNLAAQPILVQIDGETVFEAVRSEVESGRQLDRT